MQEDTHTFAELADAQARVDADDPGGSVHDACVHALQALPTNTQRRVADEYRRFADAFAGAVARWEREKGTRGVVTDEDVRRMLTSFVTQRG